MSDDVNPLPLDVRRALTLDPRMFFTGPLPEPGPPLTRETLQLAISRLLAVPPVRPRYVITSHPDDDAAAGDDERYWKVGDRVQVWELQPDGRYRLMEGDTHVGDVTYRDE